jgi:hypothetical protein
MFRDIEISQWWTDDLNEYQKKFWKFENAQYHKPGEYEVADGRDVGNPNNLSQAEREAQEQLAAKQRSIQAVTIAGKESQENGGNPPTIPLENLAEQMATLMGVPETWTKKAKAYIWWTEWGNPVESQLA